MPDLERTPLYDLNVAHGAKMVPFAGYEMPVQYPLGVMQEHLWTRAHAGLFDVSHMGQIRLTAKSGTVEDAAAALETLVPVNLLGLREGRQRYAVFTNGDGGILDDLMVSRKDDHLLLVVNAARKNDDIAHLAAHLSDRCEVSPVTDRALVALQGPEAEMALAALVPSIAQTVFMDAVDITWNGVTLWVTRSGYTGEDGFEISVPAAVATAFVNVLLDHDAVQPIGLGARDSLRLEAGLCLYGQDMDGGLSPVEASLSWAIQKVRRTGGARAGGFPGADVILPQLENGVHRHRVGLRPDGKAPMRREVPLFQNAAGGEQIGFVTSGGFGPSIKAPIAMGIVADSLHMPGTRLFGEVRGKRLPVTVADLPFRSSTYKR
ncbi:MAG: glycine cleavage system aminomethyltransferase GcvT [Pseudomonadota bacterium]